MLVWLFVPVVASFPRGCTNSRDRDLCFEVEFVAFLRRLRCMVQDADEVLAAFDHERLLSTKHIDSVLFLRSVTKLCLYNTSDLMSSTSSASSIARFSYLWLNCVKILWLTIILTMKEDSTCLRLLPKPCLGNRKNWLWIP